MKCKQFYDYTIYEDGTIVNKNGLKIALRVKKNRCEISLTIEYKKRKNYILSRLLYWLFVERFDYSNKNLCVSYKDGNSLNIALDNLYLANRKDLIQAEKHRHRAKLTDKQVKEIRQQYNGKVGSNQFDKNGHLIMI